MTNNISSKFYVFTYGGAYFKARLADGEVVTSSNAFRKISDEELMRREIPRMDERVMPSERGNPLRAGADRYDQNGRKIILYAPQFDFSI